MDLSKLPRLSETDKHTSPSSEQPAGAQEPPGAARRVVAYEPMPVRAGVGGEIWISLAVGVLIQLMSSRFWSWIFASLFGSQFTWTFSDAAGNPIAYTASIFFMGDLAMVLFGLVLIVDGIALLLSRHRPVLAAALTLTVASTAFNLLFLIQMMSKGYGLQIMSALAVVFGVYIAIYQWKLLQAQA